MKDFFNDDGWDDLRPDLGDYHQTFKETFSETTIFFLKVVGLVFATIFIVALFAYDIWREFAIFQFLTSGGAR